MNTTNSSSLIAGRRTLLITAGSHGDVQPFLVLTHAPAGVGACPIIVAPGRFDNLAARFSVGLISPDGSIPGLQDELMRVGPIRVVRSLGCVRLLIWRQLDGFAELTHGGPGRADITVFTQKTLGGASVTERLKTLGLPAQLILIGPPTSTLRAPFTPAGTPRLLHRTSWLLVGAVEASQ